MIRRLLIMRLRRHTRFARALAGRAPLASRAAVDQPILQAIGRAPVSSRRARAPVLPWGASPLIPALLPELIEGSGTPAPLLSPEPVAGGSAPSAAAAPVPTAGGGTPAPLLSPEPAAGGSAPSAAAAPEAVVSRSMPAAMPLPEPAAGGASVPPAAAPTTPDAAQASRSHAPSTAPDLSAFDRSPAAWMERLRADEQRRRQAASAPADEAASTLRMAPDTGDVSAFPPTSAAALPGEEGLPGAPGAPEIAPFVPLDQAEGTSSAIPVQTGMHIPDQAESSVVPMLTPASPPASTAPSAAPVSTPAPPSASTAPSAVPSAAQDTPQPPNPAAAIVDAARAWVAQRMQERPASSMTQQPAPLPASPKSQPQPQAPVEIRVARPPRFVTEHTPRSVTPAPAEEMPQKTDQPPPAETPVFDRSVEAWMERLRADEQRRRQAASAPADEAASTLRMAPDTGDVSAFPPTSAAALPGEEGLPGAPGAPEIAPFVPLDQAEGTSSAIPVQTGMHIPDQAESSVVPMLTPASPPASTAPSAAPVSTPAPPSASTAPSAVPSAAQDTPQPPNPAAAIVDAARAWVAQRMQERPASSMTQQPAPLPASPKSQPQPQAPVEIRVARPPRFVTEHTPRSVTPAPAEEMPQKTDQPPPAETPVFDRSVEAWMERLRADERRRRQKEAAAQAPDRSPEEAARPASVTPPAMPAPAVGAPGSSDAPWLALGSEPQRSAPQPVSASQPGVAATPTRATRFAPPVNATVRPTASGSARSPARFAPSAPPLSESNRRFLYAAVGVDPATVRVSREPEAGRVAAAYRADAVTLGDDVALAPGRGDETAEGLGLLAHELTHVARQRDPTTIPPIARPPEQRPGLRPAPPGPATDEEALARTVEAQTIQAARMRFAPPVTPARTGVAAAPPAQAPEHARAESPVKDAPAVPERARWGNLPAPWEPLPDWLALPKPAVEAPLLPLATVAPAPPALTAPPQPGAPVVRTAETARTLPAVQQSETTAPAQEPSPAPDLDELARQVYAVLKRRLAAERRRSGW